HLKCVVQRFPGERLLRIDPNAPLLRPAQADVQAFQAAANTPISVVPINKQDSQQLFTNQATIVTPMIALRSIEITSGVDTGESHLATDAYSISNKPIDPMPSNHATFLPPLISAADERVRDTSEDRQTPWSVKGLFDDPFINRTHAALIAGDSNELDRIAIDFSQSCEGLAMAQRSDQLLAEQQEQQRLQEQQHTQTRQGPTMSM
ncbi:hypothetical protein, partial [Xanthomonas fragariae]